MKNHEESFSKRKLIVKRRSISSNIKWLISVVVCWCCLIPVAVSLRFLPALQQSGSCASYGGFFLSSFGQWALLFLPVLAGQWAHMQWAILAVSHPVKVTLTDVTLTGVFILRTSILRGFSLLGFSMSYLVSLVCVLFMVSFVHGYAIWNLYLPDLFLWKFNKVLIDNWFTPPLSYPEHSTFLLFLTIDITPNKDDGWDTRSISKRKTFNLTHPIINQTSFLTWKDQNSPYLWL